MSTLQLTQGSALDFAKSEIEKWRDEPIDLFGIPLLWFDKQDNRRLARQIIKWTALEHPSRMMTVVDWARQGWGLADDALRELIVEYLDRGQQLPTYLASYNMDVAAGRHRRTRGQQKADNFLRDIAITIIVERVADSFGIKPTGRSARRKSACGVVAEALASTPGAANLGEKGVAEIWRRYGRI